jgi:ribosomal protein S18 acetylase RimI-like enzyme
MATAPSVQVVTFEGADRDQITALGPRLSIGVANWRDPEKVLATIRTWIEASLASADEDGHAVFVAKLAEQVVGFVTVEERCHWSGDADGYVGELVTAEDMEGRGVGRALMDAAERWADERGLGHLTLETGAANGRARGFYRHLGYEEEDVRLTKLLAR